MVLSLRGAACAGIKAYIRDDSAAAALRFMRRPARTGRILVMVSTSVEDRRRYWLARNLSIAMGSIRSP